jgi:hypothetical protein
VTCFETGEGSIFESQMNNMTINASPAQVAVVIKIDTATSYLVSLMCGATVLRVRSDVELAADMKSPCDPVLTR